MADFSDYLDKLRALIPARTFALYILGVGLVSGVADTPEAVAKEYGWMLLLVTGVCLAFNIIGRLVAKRRLAVPSRPELDAPKYPRFPALEDHVPATEAWSSQASASSDRLVVR